MNRTQLIIRILALGSHSKVRLEPNPPSKISAGTGRGGGTEVGRKGPKQSETNFVKLGVWGGTESLSDLNFRIH